MRAAEGDDENVQSTAEDAQLGKLGAVSLGYYRDPYIQHFTSARPARRPPLINRGNFARATCIEKVVRAFLEVGAAVNHPPAGGKTSPPQIVSLGAGKDTLFFRLCGEDADPPLKAFCCFEVDFPAVTEWKRRVILQTPQLRGLSGDGDEGGAPASGSGQPSDRPAGDASAGPGAQEDLLASTSPEEGASVAKRRYSLVAADLRDVGALEAGLRAAEVDPRAPTLILAECVLVYMQPGASSSLVQWCSKTFSSALFVNYEMIKPHDEFGKMMVQNIQRMGCGIPGLMAFPSLAAQEQRFLDEGWQAAKAADMLQVYERFLDAGDVQRAATIEVLDEVEEWQLIMRHYCLVLAGRGSAATSLVNMLDLSSKPSPYTSPAKPAVSTRMPSHGQAPL